MTTPKRPVLVQKIRGAQEELAKTAALPETVLYGEVVDSGGQPVSRAIVDVKSADGDEFVQVFSDETGLFEARGLATGRVAVRASARGADSETVEMVLGESKVPSKVLRLVIRPRRNIRARVAGPNGLVPGARLLVQTPPKIGGGRSYVTGVDGSVEVSVPVDTRQLNISVLANGYAARFFTVPVGESAELMIPVQPFGGILTVELPGGSLASPHLVHPVGRLPLSYFQSTGWDTETFDTDDGRRVIVRDLESASYSVCLDGSRQEGEGAAARCASGFLPPSGELRLQVE